MKYDYTDEWRDKLSRSHKGLIPWNKGIPATEKEKKRLLEMSKNQVRKPWTDEMKKNMSMVAKIREQKKRDNKKPLL
jgi:hypothetical protein